NFIYVTVSNTGIEEAQDAQLKLYASNYSLVADFPSDWQEIATENFDLAAASELRMGPYSWIPTTSSVSLRAVVSNNRDLVVSPNDFACDSNIAQINRAAVYMDNLSLVPGYVSFASDLLLRSPEEMG